MSEPVPAPQHRLGVRVYYEDTDAGGIVYHAAYLMFAERARTEWLRALGYEHRRLRDELGVVFAVRRCTIDYLRPARLDDLLEVRTALVRHAGATFDLAQSIFRESEHLAEITVRLVLLDPQHRPRRLPREIRDVLAGPGTIPA